MVRDPQAWFLSHGDTSFLCDKSKDQKHEPKDTPAQGWAAGERDLKFYSACQLDLVLARGWGIQFKTFRFLGSGICKLK